MNIDTTNHTSRAKFYNSVEWRHLRQQILERDHWECAECKHQGLVTTRDEVLTVDHIKPLEEHPELVMDKDNLQVLCHMHHDMKHERMNFYHADQPKKRNRFADDERWD